MAKEKNEDLKKSAEKLWTAVKALASASNEASNEQLRMNRELTKIVALVNENFIESKDELDRLISKVNDGGSISNKYIKDIAKARNISTRELDVVTKLMAKISDIDNDVIAKSKSLLDIYQSQKVQLEETADISSNILKNHERILESVKKTKQSADGFAATAFDINELLSKLPGNVGSTDVGITKMKVGFSQVSGLVDNLLSDIENLKSSITDEYVSLNLKFNPLDGQLDAELSQALANIQIEKNARVSEMQDYFKTNQQLQQNMARQMAATMSGLDISIDVDSGSITTASGVLTENSKEFKKIIKDLDSVITKNDLFSKVADDIQKLNGYLNTSRDLTDAEVSEFLRLKKAIGEVHSELIQVNAEEMQNLDTLYIQIEKQKLVLNQLHKSKNILNASVKVVDSIANGFERLNSILPSGVSEFLGISRVSLEVTRQHTKAVEVFTDSLQKGNSVAKAMQGYFSSFAPILSRVISPTTLIVAGFAALYKLASDVTDTYKKMQQETKISLGQAKDTYNLQLKILTSQRNQYATMADIQQIQNTMVGSSGKVFDLNRQSATELTTSLVEMGKYFGYGNERAVELHKTFSRLGADESVSLNLQRMLGQEAELAGLSPQIISEDLINSSEIVSTYFAGMPEKAAKAAIQVRKMGMSLQQAGQIAQKMLDLEGFMTDMYELQAMSGGRIDFSEAFDFGLSGDLEKMSESMIKQIGTMSDFNKLDNFERMKIAKTMGVQVNELANMVKLHEDMGSLSEDQQKWALANKETMGDIASMSQEDLKSKINSGMATDRMSVAFEKIKSVFTASLLPLVESFATVVESISPAIDLLILGLKGVGSIIKFISPIVEGMLLPFKFIGGVLSNITAGLDKMAGGLKVSDGILSAIKTTLTGIGVGLTALIVGAKIFGGKSLFSPVLDFFGSMLSKIPLVGSLFGGLGKSSKASLNDVVASNERMITSIESSIGKMTETVKSSMSEVSSSMRSTFTQVGTEVKKVATDVEATTATAAKKSKKSATEAIESAKQVAVQTESVVGKTQEKIKKKGNVSIVSSALSSDSFKTVAEVGSKTLAIFAVRSAMSFMQMRQEGEAQTSAMAEHMGGIMELASIGMGGMLSSALEQGIEKVFTKKLEKKFDDTLTSPIDKANKKLKKTGETSEGIFSKIGNAGKTAFSKIGSLTKKLSMAPNTTGTISASAMVDQVMPKAEIAQEVIEKVKKKKKTETVIDKPSIPNVDAGAPVKDVAESVGSGFDKFKSILKSAWDGITTILNDLVKFISDAITQLSGAAGKAFKNILTGIGDGLSSFKTSAIKGAAALLIVSAALWTTAEAIKNFENVKPEALMAAGASLAVLTGAAFVLGKASGPILEGSLAIAVLGASLIPFGYALNLMAPALEKFTPMIEAFGGVLRVVFDGISGIVSSAAAGISQIFSVLSGVDTMKILALGPALTGLSVGLAALAGGSVISSAGSALSSLFGGSALDDLAELAELADPIKTLSNSIAMLSLNLTDFNAAAANLNLDEFEKIATVDLSDKLKAKISATANMRDATVEATAASRVSPFPEQYSMPAPPRKQAVAQDNLINPSAVVRTQAMVNQSPSFDKYYNQNTYRNSQSNNSYGDDFVPDNRTVELHLQKLVQLTELLLRKNTDVNMDSSKVASKIKANFNN